MNRSNDLISGFLHLFGGILSIAGLVLMIIRATIYSNEIAWDVVSCSIFGISLVLLYTFSTLYHLLNVGKTATRVLRKFDHIMIYILIAATYTPIVLGPLRGAWGWSIFGAQWVLATLGTIFSAIWIQAPRWLTTSIYLLMGWLVIIAIYPLITTFSALHMLHSLPWLVAGGIFYTIGAIIYGLKKPNINPKYFGFHELFHVFVLLGSFCQFWFIYNYVLFI